LDCSIVSNKNFSEILSSKGVGPGPGEVGQGGVNVFHLWCHSKNLQSPTKKYFFKCRLKTCIFSALEQLSTIFSVRATRMQSHVWSSCFGARILETGRCQGVIGNLANDKTFSWRDLW